MDDTNEPWVDGLTFNAVLDRTSQRYPDHDAVVFPSLGYRRTWDRLREDVGTVARALVALGVGPGEHVGLWAANRPEWVLTQFAAAAVGAVLVNINPAYRAHELAYVLEQADVTTLLLTDHFKGSDYFALLAAARATTPLPRLRHVVSIKETKRGDILSWPEFLAGAAGAPEAEQSRRRSAVRAEDVVNIQYTSGTTGFPKGAMLTHRNLLLNAFHVGRCIGFGDRDRLALPVPFYHCFGCVMGTLMCAVYGSALVVPAESFDPEATLRAIRDERCTAVYGVPTMFLAELQHRRFADYDLRTLRTGIMAGSPCPLEVMRAVVDRMGAREMTIAYGLTEASPVITQTATTDSLEHRVGTVGRVLPGLEVKLAAPGTDEPVPPGESGELLVRGHGVMRGYYRKPADTAAVLTPDGWLRTGDLARQTPDSYYRITGRLKDLIIRGGENVYPREVEEFLYTHQHVADVQVVGLPDERFGEEVCAWVRPRPGSTLTADEVRAFCRGQIAHYKVPRYVFFVDEFPTTVTGKVQKFKLRELGIERLGLRRAAGTETA
jgi:fatty-acyl-CoA synthase